MSEDRLPTSPRRRRFTLLDAMVLTGATAGALRLCQKLMAAYDPDFGDPLSVVRNARIKGVFSAPVYVVFWFEIAAPFLLAWGLALAVLRFVPPRPRRSDLNRRPGSMAAMAIAGSVVAMTLGWCLVCLPLIAVGRFVALGAQQSPHYALVFRTVLFGGMGAGQAVAAAWLAIGVSGRWRRSRDWLDRAGFLVGALTVASMPFLLWASLLLF